MESKIKSATKVTVKTHPDTVATQICCQCGASCNTLVYAQFPHLSGKTFVQFHNVSLKCNLNGI